MNENNLSDIISSLAANKDFASMVERVKESGDLGSILGEVASLLGTQDSTEGSARGESITQTEEGVQERSAQETDENTQDSDAESKDFASETQTAGILLGEKRGDEAASGGVKRGDDGNLDTGSLLSGLLPLFTRSITENSALLLALKPYLSKKRCELIDSIIKISKLASIVSLAK